ncbi:MAG: hypothetical protein IJ880_05550 [Bacilli bacterium]|nr:hypothetical protein [Bacilli bacterium]
MTSKNQDRAQKLYQIGLKNIKLQLKLNGTQFVVMRPKENSKWKNVFGGSYSSESTLENDYDQFTTTLIVNMNDMRDVWNRNRDTLEAWTNDGSLQVGDELQYTRDGRTYRFKISLKQGFSETANSLFSYTLMSIIETLDM